MSEADRIRVGDPLPRLAGVTAEPGSLRVSVTWATGARAGRTETVDLAPHLFTYRRFGPLRSDPTLFARARLGEWGASIAWGADDDLEIPASVVEDLAARAMTNAEFSAFLDRHRLTLDAAAAQLGISRRLVAYYAKDRAIPRLVALACAYLDGGGPRQPSAG
ncbi:hypothetical protein [Methylobacterium planeticum]|uniref:DUF2442 domain-containing protein n=1 Tax=Methylobacterium planeticum TaxID=2615211 RepID=A0A6N6MN60_9HYPH|nr:hypothetical protein [Methylobacterium planeticum]KAB1071599.1 hypothetical protein F6X51_18700 [Methylobacterium planeticum]